MSFSIGECLIINDGGQERTCVVRMIDQRSQRLHYKYHFDGRPTPQIKKDNLYASPSKLQTMQARKVTIDVLGRIRRAND